MVSLGGVGHGEMSEGFFGLTVSTHLEHYFCSPSSSLKTVRRSQLNFFGIVKTSWERYGVIFNPFFTP